MRAGRGSSVCAVSLIRSIGHWPVSLRVLQCIRALSIKERLNDNQAAVRVLGLSFDRLGVELLTRWSLPQRILVALAPCPEPIRSNTNVEVRLQILSGFCMELALGLWASNLSARRQAIETQLQRFGPALRLERHQLKAHLLLADAQALEMSQALDLSVCPIAGEVFDELSTLTFSP